MYICIAHVGIYVHRTKKWFPLSCPHLWCTLDERDNGSENPEIAREGGDEASRRPCVLSAQDATVPGVSQHPKGNCQQSFRRCLQRNPASYSTTTAQCVHWAVRWLSIQNRAVYNTVLYIIALAGQIRGQMSVCRAWNALPNTHLATDLTWKSCIIHCTVQHKSS